ncbi:uncharacterized protein LOC142159875 isoform X2 [Mixophyes fleayi]|uniref:uncharacterized protein LOC142159875 isoform X2 n=1 Tax=Mixophyes fleayi TaxID=3061075 RepID=UPI003F4DEBE4
MMDKDRSHKTERILNLTLEIIYLLTGENYTVAKTTSGECVTHSSRPHVSGGLKRTQNPITVPPPHSLILEQNGDQKILDLANKIIQLLTGEVPIRCQDVTVYFSMEEWGYLEGHKGLYKDVMMENHRPLTSLDGSSNSDTPEKNHSIPEDYQSEDLSDITVEVIDEDTYMRGDQQCKEEQIPTEICTDENSRNTSEEQLLSSADYEIDSDIAQGSPGEEPSNPNIHKVVLSSDISSDPFNHMDNSPDNLEIVTHSTAPGGGTILSYSECDKCFTQNSKCILHQRSLKDEKPFPCFDCGKCFIRKSDLIKHQIIHRRKEQFPCPDCGKCFTNQPDFVNHQVIHAGERAFPCSACGKCFAYKTVLIRHQRTHSGEKPFTCSECGKCFIQKTHLVNHQRIHTGEKPFTCSECGKCFTQKADLIKHQRLHTGEKPFTCYECGKCFTKTSDFVRHQWSHTGERPFQCTACGKCFAYKTVLVNHQRIHTGEKPFSCSECGKCFRQKTHLSTHQRIHTSEKPFICSECGKCFTYKLALVKHQSFHTG